MLTHAPFLQLLCVSSTAQLKTLFFFVIPPPLQLYNGYIYASAHLHPVNHAIVIEDGKHFVDIVDAEFEIAPGDENDIKVTNMYPWGSEWLVFEDGTAAATALAITHIPSLSGNSNFHSCFPVKKCHASNTRVERRNWGSETRWRQSAVT